jgi:hypothetical protein
MRFCRQADVAERCAVTHQHYGSIGKRCLKSLARVRRSGLCYNNHMYNWSVDTSQLAKTPQQYIRWKLEQLINFGLGKNKLNKKQLKRLLPVLHVDPQKKKYLRFLLSQ